MYFFTLFLPFSMVFNQNAIFSLLFSVYFYYVVCCKALHCDNLFEKMAVNKSGKKESLTYQLNKLTDFVKHKKRQHTNQLPLNLPKRNL